MWRIPEFVPLAATGKLGLRLEQGDGDAAKRQGVGDRGADDAAADHGDLAPRRS